MFQILRDLSCLKPSSKKTRIETNISDNNGDYNHCLKPSSKKTRIETSFPLYLEDSIPNVSNHLPRKQGLKHSKILTLIQDIVVSNHLPRKQGLKHSCTAPIPLSIIVSNHLPRKQGLKHHHLHSGQHR